MRALVYLTAVAAVTLGLGCGGYNGKTFACDRGFRSSDWKNDTLRTGHSIARCDWLNGWGERRVRALLGRPYGGSVRNGLRYNLGDNGDSVGPSFWMLTIKFDDSRPPRVTDATTHQEPY